MARRIGTGEREKKHTHTDIEDEVEERLVRNSYTGKHTYTLNEHETNETYPDKRMFSEKFENVYVSVCVWRKANGQIAANEQ